MQNTTATAILLALLSMTMLLMGCSGPENPTTTIPADAPFFDVKGYFTAETARLNQRPGRVRKTVVLNGQEEIQEIDRLDYAEALDLFAKSDINRPSWYDHYAVDSTLEEGGRLAALAYTSTKEGLRTRHIRITFGAEGQVAEVYIENMTESAVATVRQQLAYSPVAGFHIQSEQALPLTAPQALSIEVRPLAD